MQVSRLQNGSIQFSHRGRQLEVTAPSPTLTDFFGEKGGVECHSQVNGVANKSLRVISDEFLNRWMPPNELNQSLSGEEFERSVAFKRVAEASLLKPGLLQVTYEDQSTEQLVMWAPEIQRLVKAISKKKSLFLHRVGGDWIHFSPNLRLTDRYGDIIGQFEIWSTAHRVARFFNVEELSGITVLQNGQLEQTLINPPDSCTLVGEPSWFYHLLLSVGCGSEVVVWDPASSKKAPRFFRLSSSVVGASKGWSFTLSQKYSELVPQEIGLFRCQKVRSLEVERLSLPGKPQVYLFRYFISSTISDGGSPVSRTQVGALDEILPVIKAAYNKGLMLVPTPQLGSLVGLQLNKKETEWKVPADKALVEALRSMNARLQIVKPSQEPFQEVTLVIAKGSSKIEVRDGETGEVAAYPRLSKEQYLHFLKEKPSRLFKRTSNGCAPVSWEQFRVALAKSDPDLRHIKSARYVGLAHFNSIRLEVGDSPQNKQFTNVPIASLLQIADNVGQKIEPLYLPVWRGEVVHWIALNGQMRLWNRWGQVIQPLNWERTFQAACDQASFELNEINGVKVENGVAKVSVIREGIEFELSLSPDSLFRDLLALQDGRTPVVRAKVSRDRNLSLNIRLSQEANTPGRIRKLLIGLLPHVSLKVAGLPLGVFGRRAFPVAKAEFKQVEGTNYRLWFYGIGTAVTGAEVSISSFIEGPAEELVQMVKEGYRQQRMLLDACLPTKDRVYLEVTRETSWDVPSEFKAIWEMGRP
jgi:hypothetical protein